MINTPTKTKRKRIFAYVENNMDKGKPSVLYATSDDNKHFFKYEIYDKSSDYEDYVKLFLHNHDNGNLPAWQAYIKFENFCLKECGFTDTNDEVIFANYPNPTAMDFFNYIADRLGAVEWALVKFIEFNYQYETTHLEKPMSFKEFRKTYGTELPEPYATKHLYDEYTRLIHKEQYTLEELNRMEQYVKSHLKDLFGTKSLYSETEIRIGWICAAMYKTDMERYLALMDFIIDEYKKETYPQTPLEELIDIISGYAIEDEYIDPSIWDEEEKKPLMDRPEYQMFKNLRTDNVEFIKKALELYKTKLK